MRRVVGWVTFVVVAAIVGCVGDDSGVSDAGGPGSLGKPCYGNGTCDKPLTCVSDVCVDLTGDASSDVAAKDAPSETAAGCPSDPVTWTSTYEPPRAALPGSCNTAQLTQFFSACLSGGDCASFQTANPQCYSCLVTPDSAGAWSAVVDYTFAGADFLAFNAAYCEETTNGAGCGKKYSDTVDCYLGACSGCSDPNNAVTCLNGPAQATSTCKALQQCIADASADPCTPADPTAFQNLFNSTAAHFCQ